MGVLIAKIKNIEPWTLIKDQVEIDFLNNIDLSDSMLYDPNNNVAQQWFRIEHLSQTDYSNNLFLNAVESGELTTVNINQLDDIVFFAYYADQKFYIQRILKGCYIKKASFWSTGDQIQYANDNKMVTINLIPDGIYDQVRDILYFQDLHKLYSIFSNIKHEYIQGTDDQVQEFLSNEMISLGEGFNMSNISLTNRKRINEVLNEYNSYNEEQKSELWDYIRKYTNGELLFDDSKFIINSDADLRLLLFGMSKRLYQPPLTNDVQVATSTTSIRHLR